MLLLKDACEHFLTSRKLLIRSSKHGLWCCLLTSLAPDKTSLAAKVLLPLSLRILFWETNSIRFDILLEKCKGSRTLSMMPARGNTCQTNPCTTHRFHYHTILIVIFKYMLAHVVQGNQSGNKQAEVHNIHYAKVESKKVKLTQTDQTE